MTFFAANGGRANEGRMMHRRPERRGVVQRRRRLHVHLRHRQYRGDAGQRVGLVGRSGERRASGEPRAEIGRQLFNGSVFYRARAGGPRATTSPTTLRKPVAEGGSGLTAPAKVISSWDANGSGGGPIKRDQLWFYGNLRKYCHAAARCPAPSPTSTRATRRSGCYVRDPNTEVRGRGFAAHHIVPPHRQLTSRNRVSSSRTSTSTAAPGRRSR